MRWQYWRFLVYINFYLTYGVSHTKTTPKKTLIKKNQRILKKWIYNNKVNGLRKRTKIEKAKGLPLSFIEQLAKYYGCSATKCRKRDVYYFAWQYKHNSQFATKMNETFEIDESVKKALSNI